MEAKKYQDLGVFDAYFYTSLEMIGEKKRNEKNDQDDGQAGDSARALARFIGE